MWKGRRTGQSEVMNETKQLRRTQQGRIIAGVCSGVGNYLGVDANIIRVGLGVLTLFGGAGIAAYAIGWLLLPDEGRPSIVQDLLAKQQNKSGDQWHDSTATSTPYPPQPPTYTQPEPPHYAPPQSATAPQATQPEPPAYVPPQETTHPQDKPQQ